MLEAHITKDGVLLTPVQVVERKRAWQGILHAMSQVRDTQPDPNENIIAEEERITEEVKAFAAIVMRAFFSRLLDSRTRKEGRRLGSGTRMARGAE